MNAYTHTERTLPSHTIKLESDFALVAELIGLLQMHRGVSMAALGGQDTFNQQVRTLQPQIDTLLAKISYQANQTDTTLWQLISSEWENTRKHWRQDSVLNNFEIHSFLIEQCHRLLWQTLEAQVKGQVAANSEDSFLFRSIPLHTESLAQLRGLSSYALASAARPDIAKTCVTKLQQLSKHCHLSLVDTQRHLIRLANRHQFTNASMMPLLQQRVRLSGQFLQTVQAVLTNGQQAPHMERIFQLGTLAIEANQKVWTQLVEQRFE